MGHSSLVSGSTAERTMKCLGSRKLIKKTPIIDAGPSEAAQLGTALHYAMEELLDDADLSAGDLIGAEIDLDEEENGEDTKTIELTSELIDTKITPAIDWFDTVLSPDDWFIEENVAFQEDLLGGYGTADVLFKKGKRRGIVDWKFGDHKKVSAKDNYQLRFYLAAAALDQDIFGGADEFDAYIVQPIENEEDFVSHTIYTRKELEDFRAELSAAVHSDSEELTTGSHCTFCPVGEVCPAWRDRGKSMLEKAEKVKENKKLKIIDHVELHDAYLEAVEVTKWAASVKKTVKDIFDSGKTISGLKRVVYREERNWSDEKKALNWVRRQGLKSADYNTQAFKSVAAIEKLLGKGNIKEALIVKSPTSFSIVSEDDKRPAYEKDGAEKATSELLGQALKT